MSKACIPGRHDRSASERASVLDIECIDMGCQRKAACGADVAVANWMKALDVEFLDDSRLCADTCNHLAVAIPLHSRLPSQHQACNQLPSASHVPKTIMRLCSCMHVGGWEHPMIQGQAQQCDLLPHLSCMDSCRCCLQSISAHLQDEGCVSGGLGEEVVQYEDGGNDTCWRASMS